MSILSILLLLSACAASPQGEEPSAPTQQPATKTYTLTDKQANEEARHLFDVLASFYGKQIMSGVVAKVDWNIVEAENVYQWTGQYPALNVFDFNNMHASKDVNPNGWLDYSDISVVRQWHQNGGVVGCMWHWNMRANNGTDMTCSPGDQAWETKFDCSRLSDTNSQEYKQVCKDIDQVASYLKLMQKEGIPVIWRPLHEAAGNIYEYTGGKAWFWWGAQGAEAYKALCQGVADGKIRSVGISNYYTADEVERVTVGADIKPAIIQNENHPFYQNTELQESAAQYGTVIESWYPLGGRGHTKDLFGNPVITDIAEAHGKTPAQIILRSGDHFRR